MSFVAELKRRNVIRVAVAYVVTAWLVIQVVETVLPIYGVAEAVIRYIITGLAVGFVPAVILAWVFELTPDGLKRDSDIDATAPRQSNTRTLDRIIMVMLALAVGYFAFDKFVLSESREEAIADAAREQGRADAVIEQYGERSIAVLPFVDMSPAKDQEYMSDGIAEELLNLLAKIPDLRVISRSSAFSFKGKDIDIPSIGEQLNARYVLEGSVRKAGNQIRITAQLIEASSDTHRWSETYDRQLENVFDIQDDIAAQVVDQLKVELLGNAPRSQRINEEAYELVLKARHMWNRRGPGDEEKVLELYRQSIAIDPEYAPAWTGLSVALAVDAFKRPEQQEAMLIEAREAVEKALFIDPSFAEAHVRLGQALAREKDYEGMKREYAKAYEAEPNNPLVLGVLASQAGREGKIGRLLTLYDRAEQLDPMGAIYSNNKAHWLLRMRRIDEAEEEARKSYSLSGNQEVMDDFLVEFHLLRGEYEAALTILERLPPGGQNFMRAVVANHGAGNTEIADQILAQIKTMEGPLPAFGVAMIYAERGDNDQAFEWLAKLEGIPAWNIVYDPYIRLLNDDPRWKPYVDSLDWPFEYEY